MQSYNKGWKEVTSNCLEVMCQLAQGAVDTGVFRQLMLILGEIYLNDLKCFGKAVETYTKLRDFASFHTQKERDRLVLSDKNPVDHFDKPLKLSAYYLLGQAYQGLRQYDAAITCFKRQLQLCWILQDEIQDPDSLEEVPSELKAYEGISQSYFYLGKTAKARYYFERHSRGKYEAPFSTLKKIYQTKHQDKFNALKLQELVVLELAI